MNATGVRSRGTGIAGSTRDLEEKKTRRGEATVEKVNYRLDDTKLHVEQSLEGAAPCSGVPACWDRSSVRNAKEAAATRREWTATWNGQAPEREAVLSSAAR